eukprot:CAMPEP_0182530802 /NCGR_PEP_ID=MMETSP1323-20130603/6737_1 /TAXON_ID=236787 /ORGANISM="Florenciella parvula, Strain RCC1693" /LENGTH=121 /DNA_ID=CAMNT_0024740165 /DNA_START=84 /DNA_END=449 /DNA_ORIENTATION=+
MLRALLLLLATGATAFTVPTTQRALFKAPARPLSRVIARSDPVKQEFDPDLIPDSSAEAADDFYSLENNGLDAEPGEDPWGRSPEDIAKAQGGGGDMVGPAMLAVALAVGVAAPMIMAASG